MRDKKLTIIIAIIAAFVGTYLFFRYAPGGADALWNLSGGGAVLLPLVAVSALIDSVNPCAFSVLLLTVAFLLSVGKLRARILAIGGSYVLGVLGAYLAIGLGLLGALHLFNTPHFMGKLGAALLIALGAVQLLGALIPRFPVRIRIPERAHHAMAQLVDRSSVPAAFALGALVGLCEFPCTGGPYLMVVGLLHDRETYAAGFGYLVLYNLIFILPLVVLLVLASDRRFTTRVEAWQKSGRNAFRVGAGIIMMALGAGLLLI